MALEMMNLNMTRIAIAVFALSVLVAGCKRSETSHTDDSGTATGTEAAQTATGTDVGARMPEYTAMNLDGSRFDLAGRRSKVVLLNLWATWCGPCRYEIPELQRIHDQYAAKGFEVVGVSVDEGGVEGVKQFIAEQKKMTYPVALDPEGKLATLLSTSVLPTSILVGRDGKVLWKKYGVILENDQELLDAIAKAL